MSTTAAITAALALCPKPADRQLPQPLVDAQAITDRFEPYAASISGTRFIDLAEQLVSAAPDDFDRVLDTCATEYARRAFVAATRQHATLPRLLGQRMDQALGEAVPIAVKRLTPVFRGAVSDLQSVAGDLPAGHAATDPQAVLEANAGSAYHQARTALTKILTIGALHAVPLRTDGSTPQGSQLVSVIDIPDLPVEEIHPLTERRLTDPVITAQIDAVRTLVRDYAANPRQAVLDVARGNYGDAVTLWLAPDRQAVLSRLGRIANAQSRRRLREYDQSSDRGWAVV